MDLNDITGKIIGAAIEVHHALGPGLLESMYEESMIFEMRERGLTVEAQKPVPFIYKNNILASKYRLDLLVEHQVIVEIKAVEKLLPIHQIQLLSYMRMTNCRLGLLINFHVCRLKDGIKRLII
jgi:GxxExxY protein